MPVLRAALCAVLLLCVLGLGAAPTSAPAVPASAAAETPTPVPGVPVAWADLAPEPLPLTMRWSSDLLGQRIDVAPAIPALGTPSSSPGAAGSLTPVGTPAPTDSLAPAGTLASGSTLAPASTLAPSGTLSPSDTLAPSGTLDVTPASDTASPLAPNATPIAGVFPDRSRLAYCGADGIWRSLDGGASWEMVPTDSVAAVAATTLYPLAPHAAGAPACRSVTQDPLDPETFYAAFTVVRPPQDAPPPLYFGGFVTRDAGQSWQAIPRPNDSSEPFFGGVFVLGDRVQALYGEGPFRPAAGPVAPPRVFETLDSGASWQPASFDCPASGPCVRWGAAPSGIGSCAMHGAAQRLLVSDDGGRTWAAPEGAPVVNACQPNQLAVLSDTDVLLLAPGGSELDPTAAPVRLSRDGGRTFAPLALPESPDLREVTLLPDGRLLALTAEADASWLLLVPGAATWSSADTTSLPGYRVPLSVAADRLWWLGETGAPRSVPLGDIARRSCEDAEATGSAAPSS